VLKKEKKGRRKEKKDMRIGPYRLERRFVVAHWFCLACSGGGEGGGREERRGEMSCPPSFILFSLT